MVTVSTEVFFVVIGAFSYHGVSLENSFKVLHSFRPMRALPTACPVRYANIIPKATQVTGILHCINLSIAFGEAGDTRGCVAGGLRQFVRRVSVSSGDQVQENSINMVYTRSSSKK